MNTTLRLSDILGRGVAVEWFEAVALVREVADRVRDSVGGRGVPELDEVQLWADGSVTLSGATKTDEPIRRLGQLLQACLVQTDPPVQLRLVLSQATAPEPAYSSLGDYVEALAYFERPDRPAVLRTLYERAQAVPTAREELAVTLDSMAPLHGPKRQGHQNAASASRRAPSKRAVAALAAVVVLVAAATVYSQYVAKTPTTGEVSALAAKASDAVGATLVKGISAVSESVGLGRLVPADGPVGAPPVAATASPKAASGSARTPPVRVAERFQIFDLATAPPPVPSLPALAPSAAPVVEEETRVVEATEPEPTNGAIYSASDEDVVAPIGIRPQLPRALPTNVRLDQLSQIELVILPDGTVGSVKLLGARRSVLEGMLLSAAKAWKFKPAEKDGHPVAYRKTVWLALQ